MTKLKLGLYQGHPVQGNIELTLRKMESIAKQAHLEKVDLLIFPELFVTGYLPELWERIPNAEEELEWTTRLGLVAKTMDLWIVFGHPSYRTHQNTSQDNSETRKLSNAATLLSPKGIVGTYAKVHLYGDEEETFFCGSDFPVWETKFGRIAVQICYDLEFPESARMVALQGADLLLNIANNMAPYGAHHVQFTMARALENGMFVATVNRIAQEKTILFCGNSCVAHPQGNWLLAKEQEEGLFCVYIDLKEKEALDASVLYMDHRHPEAYGLLTQV
jgi:predicted amidohydrolase